MKKATRWAELRRAAGMTQLELANKLGVSDMTVYRWERENKQPKIEILPVMAQALSTSTDYLLGLTDDPSPSVIISEDGKRVMSPRITANRDAIVANGDGAFASGASEDGKGEDDDAEWWPEVLAKVYKMKRKKDPRVKEARTTLRTALDVLDSISADATSQSVPV